jgi:hypothetical protein
MKTEEPKMITAKEYAEIHDVHYTTVMNWLRRDLLPGAIKEELPFGGYFYKIPVSAPIPELKPGPKRKSADAEGIDDQEPTKPKRGASKRSTAKKANVTRSTKKGARAK